jgi:hypothetical protein
MSEVQVLQERGHHLLQAPLLSRRLHMQGAQ